MMPALTWQNIRQAIIILGLFGVFWFSWASHARTLFNGLATPLFLALAAYLCFLASQYKIAVSRGSLLLYLLFAGWVVFVDARSGEFLPALAKDSHWLILPLACLLIAQVFREYPRAFEFIQIGAALCIINLLLTMFVMAEWYDNWHYPPIFGHIRHLGLSVGFLTILLFARTESSALIGAFFRIARILGLALVFWSGTRASILAWLCCMVIFVILDRSWFKTLLIDTTLAIALSLIPSPAFPVNQWTPGTVARTLEVITGNAPASATVTSGRLGIWQSTLTGLADINRLWTGVGGNGFARLQVLYGAEISVRGHIHPHNVIVQFICDWGIIGLILLLSFFSQSTLRPIISNARLNNPTALTGVVYLLITGMFDATLYHLEHLIYLAISIAYLSSRTTAEPSNRIALPSVAGITFILALMALQMNALDYRIGLYWYFPTQ